MAVQNPKMFWRTDPDILEWLFNYHLLNWLPKISETWRKHQMMSCKPFWAGHTICARYKKKQTINIYMNNTCTTCNNPSNINFKTQRACLTGKITMCLECAGKRTPRVWHN